jgi:hypothetical protein
MTVFASRFDVEARTFPKDLGDRNAQPLSSGFELRHFAGRKANRKHLGSS